MSVCVCVLCYLGPVHTCHITIQLCFAPVFSPSSAASFQPECNTSNSGLPHNALHLSSIRRSLCMSARVAAVTQGPLTTALDPGLVL